MRPPIGKTVRANAATQILAGGSRNFIFWLDCRLDGCAIQASIEIAGVQFSTRNDCRGLMKLRIVHKSLFAVPVLSALVALVLAVLVHAGFFNMAELQGYDLLVFAGGAAPPNENIAIVDFDNASVEAIGKYPIPRKTMARVLARIADGQPAIVGLDKLLSDTSDKESDDEMVAALDAAGIVVVPEVFGTDQVPADQPVNLFRRKDRPAGFVNLIEDSDGFIRRMFVYMKTESVSGLSFPVEIASQYLGQPLTREGPGVFRLGNLTIHLDGTGRETALLGAWNRRPAKLMVSAEQLLSGEFDVSAFRGKIVLVGESSTAGKDLYATPVFRFRGPGPGRAQLSGVEIHAVALNSILSGRIIRVMEAPVEWSLGFLFILAASALVILLRLKFGIPATLLVFGGVFLTAHLLFSRANLWMHFVSIEAGAALALTAGLGYRFWREGVLKSQAEEAELHEAGERKKLEDEISSAREIQESLLPATLPKCDALELAARYQACLAIGGDYYDFLQLGPAKLLFVIADVQGHGVSSAMVMANLQGTLRNLMHGPQANTPAAIVAALNDALLEATRGERLVTLFLSILDVSTREMVYVNAGHVRPLLFRRGESEVMELVEGGFLLGVFPGSEYEQASIILKSGDVLLAMTDGITEAMNPANEEFSVARVEDVVRANLGHSAGEIIEDVYRSVAVFERGGHHEDDKVVVVMKVV
jgi:serine phosphatase RsbU (regulator of sigma subunit)/CHASE2 domain-containing sensor protein